MFTLINFYGKWDIEILSKQSPYDIQLEVRGSGGLIGGGVYGQVGSLAHVNGPDWHISFEWSKPGAFLWHACEAKKLEAAYPTDKGLVVTVGARPDLPTEAGKSYDHLVIRLRNKEPLLNPFIPITTIPDFTYRRGTIPHHRS
ncbi:hypothetical protein [Pseudoduganella violacea]|uniref:Uncharacterized protein n=1 Tax=Pseudoduganella violacea TaxID=1715466 RepID=A0A7W5FXN4_9BURK|nr:hypothetical protein [Pseudoduganella violacea]MBB3122468.1 hypothetical protein [Pseudoduganella violacea]